MASLRPYLYQVPDIWNQFVCNIANSSHRYSVWFSPKLHFLWIKWNMGLFAYYIFLKLFPHISHVIVLNTTTSNRQPFEARCKNTASIPNTVYLVVTCKYSKILHFSSFSKLIHIKKRKINCTINY